MAVKALHEGYIIVELKSFFRLGGSAPFDPVSEQKKAKDLIMEKLQDSTLPYQVKETINGELILICQGKMEELVELYYRVRELERVLVERMKLYIVPEIECGKG
jgi:hypothetical protein